MRIFIKMLLVVVLALGAAAVGYAIHETVPAETMLTMPGADAKELYLHITRDNPYEKWDLWPGKGKLYEGTEPQSYFIPYLESLCLKDLNERFRSLAASVFLPPVKVRASIR